MFQGKGKNAGKALNEHTKEELIQMVCHLKECKKFGLVWEDKPEDVEERLRKSGKIGTKGAYLIIK